MTNILKTAIVGPSFVGKTVLCQALTGVTIDREYTSTIGVDYLIKYTNDGTKIALWDLAGLERFQDIIKDYIRMSKILIFCYSSENIESYHKMKKIHDKCKENNFVQNKLVIIAITKTESKLAIKNCENWADNFIKDTSYPIVKTSAFTGSGIQELYNIIINHNKIVKNIQQPTYKKCILS
jgi:small GTP-binding protein